jgi:hypothetical protein
MGMTRITIETFQDQAGAVAAGKAAVATVREKGGSVSVASAVYHPGEADEATVDLLAE